VKDVDDVVDDENSAQDEVDAADADLEASLPSDDSDTPPSKRAKSDARSQQVTARAHTFATCMTLVA
jgi:hypothetical protein